MPTKAERKQLDGAVAAFHSHYSRIWGDQRWHESLFPTLSNPTRYALMVNRFAHRSDLDRLLRDSNISWSDLKEVRLPKRSLESNGSPLLLFERPSVVSEANATEMVEAGSERRQESETGFLFPAPVATPSAVNPTNALMTHWNLDAASALAAHLLEVHPGERVLDLCAAPGGKSVALAQLIFPHLHADHDSTLSEPSSRPGCLHCNELDPSRNKRLAQNLKSYLPPHLFQEGLVKILRIDGTGAKALQQLPNGPGGYDKVLLDAPCSSERHIIHAYPKAAAAGRAAEEMSRWRPSTSKNLAKLQTSLLITALQAVRVGGKVVYSTCSIEPGENDGVVEKMLETLEKQRKKLGWKWDVAIETGRRTKLKTILHKTEKESDDKAEKEENSVLDQLTELTEYGRIALPDHHHPSASQRSGWGPLYCCVINKVASK